MPRTQLQTLTPSFNWEPYWKALGLTSKGIVNVTEPAFYAEVEKQLKTRPIADWQTYLRWHAAHNRAPYLAAAFVQEDFDFFSKHLHGVKEPPPRWKPCVRLADRDLGEAID